MNGNDFSTCMPYMARDRIYYTEKPYTVDFTPENGEAASNHVGDHRQIIVHNIPPASRDAFHLDVHGFCVLKAKTKLSAAEALMSTRTVQQAYAEEVEDLLHNTFPEYSRIETMNVVVRKRDPRFPSDEVAVVSHDQPAGLPHSDNTFQDRIHALDHAFPGQIEHFRDKDYDLLNLWRPLTGPNDDWPLAMCDYESIEENDIINNDDIHRDRVGENSLLHYSPKHRWYYICQQTPEDVFVFRNTDSTGHRARGFHCAVENPTSRSEARCSIEARLVAIR